MPKTAPQRPLREKNIEAYEQVIALYLSGYSQPEIAKKVGRAKSTVHDWIKKYKAEDPDSEIEHFRDEKRKAFASKAWDIITDAMALLGNRITTALQNEAELDVLIDTIMDDDTIGAKQKQALVCKVNQLQLHNIRDISTVVGTLYDKQALAQGESTQNVSGLDVTIKVVD